jgi:AraC-like DNA-binding protein
VPVISVADRVFEFVERNYAKPISLRHVARATGYSSSHLTTVFRLATGSTVTAWIIKRRIDAACQLLQEERFTVADACESVGFTDLCYFRRQFARYVGTTPGRYRSGHKRQNSKVNFSYKESLYV